MTGPTEGGLLELHARHLAAWNDLDLDALARLYDPDCLIFDTYAPPDFEGWEEFRARIEPELARFDRFRITTSGRRAEVDGRFGWVASRYVIDALRDGTPYRRTGRWTEIYARRGGGWRLVHLHSSVDP